MGEWRQAAIAIGVAGSLSERIGAQLFPLAQADIDAIAAETALQLGAAAAHWQEAGRAAGRGDRIAAALALASGQAPLHNDLPLTRRENEITQLIARGLTNRQIAQQLFIAQRTVDTHVGHILAKLDCSNRSQVAALVVTAER